ncbi:DUF1385 domain-containing protein [candidate division KSB1 bacterium]
MEAQVGGQAVIEGVMIRSPKYIATAVKSPNGKIYLKKDKYNSFAKKYKLNNIPVIRGAVILIESLVIGIKALMWSAEIASDESEQNEEKSDKNKKGSFFQKLSMVFSLILGLSLGIGLFFYLPLYLTDLLGIKEGILFNIVDGIIRLIIFGLYIFLISLWKEFRRIFEFHGAEHKSIYSYENGEKLTVENARKHSTLHPRCGTSFLLIVMITSMIVFIFLGRPDSISDKLIRFLFIPVIAGISYEILKFSGKFKQNSIVKLLILPGLMLQKVTTKEPSDEQLYIGLTALKYSLDDIPVSEPDIILIS